MLSVSRASWPSCRATYITDLPSCNSNEAKLCRRSYGRAPSRPIAAQALSNPRRRQLSHVVFDHKRRPGPGKTSARLPARRERRRHSCRSSASGASSRTVRCARVFVSCSSPSDTARSISSVRSRTSPHRSASASPGRSPAYASTEISVASRSRVRACCLVTAGGPPSGGVRRAVRRASTVTGASGRTSRRAGRPILRTSRVGLRCQRPSVSPQRRPSNLPTGGHVLSPLVAIGSPRLR
jgi:hypothetical protein